MKIEWGALVVDGSGKLGGHVAAKNRGGAYLRTKVTPLNPQSEAQSLVRGLFASISSAWSGLSVVARTSWNAGVEAFGQTNIFGDLKIPSGKALFQRLNQNLALSGQAQLTVCPQVAPVEFVELVSVDASVAGSSMVLETNGATSDSVIIVEATPILSAGTSNAKNKFRVLGFVAGADADGFDFGDLYIERFGAFTVSSNFQV